MTERQVAEKRFFTVSHAHISGQVVGNPRQVIVVQHDAFWWPSRSGLEKKNRAVIYLFNIPEMSGKN